MRIISKFKDYYDYVSNVYGSDNALTYTRNTFEVKDGETDYFVERIKEIPRLDMSSYIGFNYCYWEAKWLCVCGKYYLIVKRPNEETYNVFTKEQHPELYKRIIHSQTWLKRKYKDYVDCYDDSLVELSKKLKQPVFIIDMANGRSLSINDKIPKLDDFPWFTQHYSPQETWQNISQFLANVIRENPDTKPPVELTNTDKITKAGFDMKLSFRKRK